MISRSGKKTGPWKLFGDGNRVLLMTNATSDFSFLGGARGEERKAMGAAFLLNAGQQKNGTYFQTIAGIRNAAVYATNEYLGLTLAQYFPESEVLNSMLQVMCVLNGTQDPNLRDKQLLDLYEAATPDELLNGSFMLPGEVSQLFNAIQELSGFGEGAVSEVKN